MSFMRRETPLGSLIQPASPFGLTEREGLMEHVAEEGVISRAMPHGDILGFAPPLIIKRDEMDDLIDRVARAVEKVSRRL